MRIFIPKMIVVLLLAGLLPAQDALLLRAKSAHLGTGEVITPALVHVAGGRIVAIGARPEVPEGAREIDLGDAVLVEPGLDEARPRHGGVLGLNAVALGDRDPVLGVGDDHQAEAEHRQEHADHEGEEHGRAALPPTSGRPSSPGVTRAASRHGVIVSVKLHSPGVPAER